MSENMGTNISQASSSNLSAQSMAARSIPPPLESPAIPMSQPRRKRRPTRTPKPSGQKSRLCSPSPFLDRSFHRKKLLFAASKNDDDESVESSGAERSESLEYDPPSDKGTDSEYDIAEDLNELQHDEEDDDDEYEYHSNDEQKSSKRSHSNSSDCLVSDMENMQIGGGSNPKLARNARVSVKMHKTKPLECVQTPQLFVKQHTKIKKRTQKEVIPESNKLNKSTKPSKSSKPSAVKEAHKKTVIRITRSTKVFTKSHVFGTLLVKPAECGSGCPLYRSSWRGQESVTKLMPLWENAEFTKEENVDNALREFEFHADVYRKGCKAYGVKDCPVVSIMACVKLRHPVVASEGDEEAAPPQCRDDWVMS